MGRGRLRIVPQIPSGQHFIASRNIRLGTGSVDVAASRRAGRLTTRVDVRVAKVRVKLGHVLPAGARIRSVSLDGHQVAGQVQRTSRGREVVVPCGSGSHRLVVLLR
jgi:methionine-rich copper-binding protein CopC